MFAKLFSRALWISLTVLVFSGFSMEMLRLAAVSA
jgi:hypothetical protein